MFIGCEPAYMSTSLVFESKFANHILFTFPELFESGHIVLAIHENSLRDFIEVKQNQYAHATERYQCYYSNQWKMIADIGPSFIHKDKDTSATLENSMVSDIADGGINLSVQRLGVLVDKNFLLSIQPFVIDAILGHEDKAITRKLFEDIYLSRNVSEHAVRAFDIKVSEHYVTSYIQEISGTIATGLSCGIEYFTYLCPTYPFHHLSVWREIYSHLGCSALLNKFSGHEIGWIRSTVEFRQFISKIRSLLKSFIKTFIDFESERPGSLEFYSALRSVLRQIIPFPMKTPEMLEDFLLILANTTKVLEPTAENIRNNSESLFLKHFKDKFVKKTPFMLKKEKKMKVFVVHGRNDKARRAVFEFLRAVGLEPIEWSKAMLLTGKATPYIGEVLDTAFNEAQTIVVLFTGDDEARLRPEFLADNEPEEIFTPQPRANVLFEAGMALGRNPNRTILIEIGTVHPFNDIAGRHILRLTNNPEKRQEFVNKLITAGCEVDTSGTDWLSAGDFDSAVI